MVRTFVRSLWAGRSVRSMCRVHARGLLTLLGNRVKETLGPDFFFVYCSQGFSIRIILCLEPPLMVEVHYFFFLIKGKVYLFFRVVIVTCALLVR